MLLWWCQQHAYGGCVVYYLHGMCLSVATSLGKMFPLVIVAHTVADGSGICVGSDDKLVFQIFLYEWYYFIEIYSMC